MEMTYTIVELRDTAVMYVAGDKGTPIAEQAPKAMQELEARLTPLKGRKFYGVVLGDEYRACVTLAPAEANPEPLPTWTIPGGRYVRRRVLDYESNILMIGQTVAELCRRIDVDPSRPTIEYYRSQKEVLVMVPIR